MADTRGRSAGGAAFMRERYAIDEAAAQSLLDAALSRGGDYAELYFEHTHRRLDPVRAAGGEDGQPQVSQGVGVRVLLGEAVGYAYTEDLSREAMLRAADTAAKIASRGAKATPVDIVHYDTAQPLLARRQHHRCRSRRQGRPAAPRRRRRARLRPSIARVDTRWSTSSSPSPSSPATAA